MRNLLRVGIAGLMAASILGTAPAAFANDADVIATGPCSGASDWKLKASPENGGIEIEFEVDQNVVGDTWKVVIRQNGTRIFRGQATTTAPSGSFEVRRVTNNQAGADHFTARARNLSTGETCQGAVTF